MGLINAINQWRESKYQNHISRMREENKCPDCRGRGYTIYPYNEFAYFNSYECPGCQGSGSFSAWDQLT